MIADAARSVRPWGTAGPEVEFCVAVETAAQNQIVPVLLSWDVALFGVGPIKIDCLPGGANNRNYRIDGPNVALALRLASPMSDRLAVDRASAVQAQRDAAAVGVAPELLACQLPEGHTLSRFLEGTVLPWDSLTDRRIVREVGVALRQLHASASSCRSFSPFEEIRHWVALTRADGTSLVDDINELLASVAQVERAMLDAQLPEVFCHNDTVPQNFIRSRGKVRLVDWDYAGRGWAAFELAAFCNTTDLADGLREELFDAYSGGASGGQRATIGLLAFVAAMREVAWAYMAKPVLEGTTTLLEGWSYDGFLSANLVRARRLMEQEDFGDLCGCALGEQGRQW